MDRFIRVFIFLLLVPAFAQAGSSLRVEPLRDQLFVLFGDQGGNIVVSAGKDGTILIDDQITENLKALKNAVKKIGSEPVSFILNTHYHYDHTGGNNHYGDKGAIIVAHGNVRKRLSSEHIIEYFKKSVPATEAAGLPVITFTRDIALHLNDDDINIQHIPNAHTDGDAFVHFRSGNVIVGGDLLFSGMYPFIDIEAGGSVEGVIKGTDEMLALANAETIIVPGHGALMTPADLKAYRDMLVSVTKTVRKAIADGATRESVIDSKPTKAFDNKYGGGLIGPEAFAGRLYDDLSR